MQWALSLEGNSAVPLQLQLFEQIRKMILGGQLRPGDPLPASRSLSEMLGVSRNTVLLAYERLFVEGYVESRRSVGTFVTLSIPDNGFQINHAVMHQRAADGEAVNALDETQISPYRKLVFSGRAQRVLNPHRSSPKIDFWVGRPDPRSFPLKAWHQLLDRRLHAGSAALTEYQDPQGVFALRQAIADRLGPARRICVRPDEIIITGGSQNGIMLASALLLDVGGTAVIENPCYQGALYAFESRGAKIVPVPVDHKGLRTASLPKVKGALCYVTPSHQYPIGGTMPLARRLKLLEWAYETGSYIIEDDYDGDYRYQGAPLTALKGLDVRGNVIYAGTFSKSMGAALRLGYLVLPPELVVPARTLKTLLDNGQPWLEQAVMADFLHSGGFDCHLRRIRRLYLAKRNRLVAELRGYFGSPVLSGADGGMHLVWHLPPHYPPASEIQALALQKGVGVYTIDSGAACLIAHDEARERLLILGYSSLSEEEIARGVALIAQAIDETSHSSKRASAHLRIIAQNRAETETNAKDEEFA